MTSTEETRIKQILAWARRDQKAILDEPKPAPPPVHDKGGYRDHNVMELHEWRNECARWQARRDDAAAGYVELNLAGWLDRQPTRSEIVSYSRAYLVGAEAGHWQRVIDGGKTWALKLP